MKSIIALAICMDLFSASQALDLPKILQPINESLTPTSSWHRTYDFKVWKLDMKFRPFDFRLEAILLSFALLYLISHFIGKARNRRLARAWMSQAMPMLEDEFAFVGKEDEKDGHHVGLGEGEGRIIWNGAAEALSYTSGRRGAEGLQVLFTFIPWHDLFQLLYNFVNDIATAALVPSSQDVLTYNFLLPYQSSDNVSGVFALVDKTVLRSTRKGRFDLTFAKVIDSENANEQRNLSTQYAIMSEVGELTDAILGEVGEKGNNQRHRVGLQSALNSEAGKQLYSLVFSDQPPKRPEDGPVPIAKRQRNLTLTLRMPYSKEETKYSLALLEAACNLVDALELGHVKLNNTTIAKLRNIRSSIDKELEEEATKWQKEEEEEAKQEAKRKAEKEKFDKLSPTEQEKRKQLEKKRLQRKAQGKASKAR